MDWTEKYPTVKGVYWMMMPGEKPRLVVCEGRDPNIGYYEYNNSLHHQGYDTCVKIDLFRCGFRALSLVNPIQGMNQPGIVFSDSPVLPPAYVESEVNVVTEGIEKAKGFMSKAISALSAAAPNGGGR